MSHLGTLQTAVVTTYNLLPEGTRELVAEIHGCSSSYFRKIVRGKAKKDEAYLTALGSIKKASLQNLEASQINHKEIITVVSSALQETIATP